MFFVDAAHQCGCRRQYLIDEDEDSFLGRELDPLSNHIDKLAYGEICWNKVLLLVDGGDIGFLDLLTDDLNGDPLATEQAVRRGGRGRW